MNLSELRDLVRSIANVDDVRLPDTELDLFINDAIDEIMTYESLRFGEAHITTAFVEDTQTINPAPTNGRVLIPLSMYYLSDTQAQAQVEEITWAEYVQRYGVAPLSSTGGGDPVHFAVYGEDDDGNPTFWLGPIPDADRTVYLDARITFDMVDDDDENPLCDAAPLAIVYKTLTHAAAFLENEERMSTWSQLYEQHAARLRISHSGARHGAKVARSMQEPS